MGIRIKITCGGYWKHHHAWGVSSERSSSSGYTMRAFLLSPPGENKIADKIWKDFGYSSIKKWGAELWKGKASPDIGLIGEVDANTHTYSPPNKPAGVKSYSYEASQKEALNIGIKKLTYRMWCSLKTPFSPRPHREWGEVYWFGTPIAKRIFYHFIFKKTTSLQPGGEVAFAIPENMVDRWVKKDAWERYLSHVKSQITEEASKMPLSSGKREYLMERSHREGILPHEIKSMNKEGNTDIDLLTL